MPEGLTVDFYLVSSEGPNFEPRGCRIVRRLANEIRDDLALVELGDPLPTGFYDEIYKKAGDSRPIVDLGRLILAARHHHRSLFPVTAWPTAVRVCILRAEIDPDQTQISSTIFSNPDWGEIFPTRAEAAAIYDQFKRNVIADAAMRAIVGANFASGV